MGIISLLGLILPIIGKLLDLFISNPSSAASNQKQALEFLEGLNAAVKKTEDTHGDTSSLEDLVNK